MATSAVDPAELKGLLSSHANKEFTIPMSPNMTPSTSAGSIGDSFRLRGRALWSKSLSNWLRMLALLIGCVLVWAILGRKGLKRQPRQRIFLRGNVPAEGIGSALQRFKESIVLSEVLNATLVLTNTPSEHGYSTSDIINANFRDAARNADVTKACDISQHTAWQERTALVKALCEHEGPAYESARTNLSIIAEKLDGCTVILDSQPEVHEDLNGCILPWLRARLRPVAPKAFDEKRVTVGIHIRWGDSAREGDTAFRGSMSIETMNELLDDIHKKFGTENVQVTIAMEQHDQTILSKVHASSYTLLDSNDHIGDMKKLAANNILLFGDSSYAALAHLLAPPGLTIVEGWPWKYLNTSSYGREFIDVNNYNPSVLDKVQDWASQPWIA